MLEKLVIGASDFLLKVGTRLVRGASALARHWTDRHATHATASRIWIDVGAHRGETTFEHARKHPDLTVYAFEPDVSVASHRYALLKNFVIVPMAVSEEDGFREFHINSNDRTSSLLPLDDSSMTSWQGAEGIRTERKAVVPTVRLDTFMNALGINQVEYLKIDAQGHDLEVVRSLGHRLRDVQKIRLEAYAARSSMYVGAHNRVDEMLKYMESVGFEVIEDEPESLGQERNMVFRPAVTKAEWTTVRHVDA
jgi:FkbM family methyltransferase